MEGEKAAYPPANPAGYPPADPSGYPPPDPATYPASNPPPNYYPPTDPNAAYPQGAGAGGYYSQPQGQPSSNVVVVTQPAQPVVAYSSHGGSDVGQGALILAVFVTIFAFICCWWALFCSIPAIIFASNASSSLDADSARSNRNISFALSGVTLLTGLAGIAIVFGVIFGYYLPLVNSLSSVRFG